MNAIEVQQLHVSYQDKPVLWNIHFQVPAGVNYAIIGPNGAGKTTLLKALLGEVKPALGAVRFFGHPLDEVRNRVSYVPQRQLVDWDFPVNVLDVVLMGRYASRGLLARIHRSDRERAMEALASLGMVDLASRQISKLSGGQQQRVFIARALAADADLYIMDEPFAGVDLQTEKVIVDILHRLKKEGRTTLTVHHDLTTVSEYFDGVIMINGRLVACGPVAETFRHNNLSETFGGKLPILESVIQQSHKNPVQK